MPLFIKVYEAYILKTPGTVSQIKIERWPLRSLYLNVKRFHINLSHLVYISYFLNRIKYQIFYKQRNDDYYDFKSKLICLEEIELLSVIYLEIYHCQIQVIFSSFTVVIT